MKMNIIQYTINLLNLDAKRLLGYWTWLIGDDKEIMVVTKMGDLVLKDAEDKLYFLSIAEGTIDLISNYANDFFKNRLTAKQYFEMFQPEFISELKEDGRFLTDGQIYAYIKLPLNGGKSSITNIHRINIYEYYAVIAALHKEIDELPKNE